LTAFFIVIVFSNKRTDIESYNFDRYFLLFVIQKKLQLTPEEKQLELKWHRDILLATIDYSIERSNKERYGEFDIIAHYQQLKEQTEEHYQKGRLAKLKQWLRDMTEAPREMEDFGFGRYIKDKTGYDLDIFASFHKRIDKIIERKQIKTENQYREVMSMIDNLCQQTPVDQKKIDLLNNLIINFEDKISGTKTPKRKRKSSAKKEYFFNVLLESPSPDNKRKLILIESGTDESDGYTQVQIQFEDSGSGVYAPNGINLGVKTYWKDNHTIVIETKKEFRATQKWEQVQNYQDIIKVEYIEK
jgi:hypothetical protein